MRCVGVRERRELRYVLNEVGGRGAIFAAAAASVVSSWKITPQQKLVSKFCRRRAIVTSSRWVVPVES